MAEVSPTLRAYLVRLLVLALGLAGMVGAAVLHKFAGLGLAPTVFLEYAAVTCVVRCAPGGEDTRVKLYEIMLGVKPPPK